MSFLQAYLDDEKVKDVLSKNITFDANVPYGITESAANLLRLAFGSTSVLYWFFLAMPRSVWADFL